MKANGQRTYILCYRNAVFNMVKAIRNYDLEPSEVGAKSIITSGHLPYEFYLHNAEHIYVFKSYIMSKLTECEPEEDGPSYIWRRPPLQDVRYRWAWLGEEVAWSTNL